MLAIVFTNVIYCLFITTILKIIINYEERLCREKNRKSVSVKSADYGLE